MDFAGMLMSAILILKTIATVMKFVETKTRALMTAKMMLMVSKYAAIKTLAPTITKTMQMVMASVGTHPNLQRLSKSINQKQNHSALTGRCFLISL